MPYAELQGIYTAKEIHAFLQEKGNVDDYPLFKAVRLLLALQPLKLSLIVSPMRCVGRSTRSRSRGARLRR